MMRGVSDIFWFFGILVQKYHHAFPVAFMIVKSAVFQPVVERVKIPILQDYKFMGLSLIVGIGVNCFVSVISRCRFFACQKLIVFYKRSACVYAFWIGSIAKSQIPISRVGWCGDIIKSYRVICVFSFQKKVVHNAIVIP